MRAVMEWTMAMVVAATFAVAIIITTTATMTAPALSFSGFIEVNAENSHLDAPIRQFSEQHSDVDFFTNDDVSDALFVTALAYARAIGDLKHIGQVVHLKGDGFAVLIDGYDFTSQLLLHGLLGSSLLGCGWCGGGRFILRSHRLSDSSGQRQQQAEDNGCFYHFHCYGVAVDG